MRHRKRTSLAAAVVALALLAAPSALAEDTTRDAAEEGGAETRSVETLVPDLAAGEEHYQSVCRNCHGPSGQGLSSYPRLAGLDAEYLTYILGEYRAGETIGYNTMLMAPHAKELSDQDIANLAGYIAETFE